MKKITVVTVVYNSVHNVEETLLNVLGQTWGNLEYIVIDGGSTDGTVDVIKKYADRITLWISEKDKGIFDAMNKSLLYVTGEYVLFMNAGDTFVSNCTIEKVFNQDIDGADLIYGDAYIRDNLGYKLYKADSIYAHNPSIREMIFKSQGFSHQALFSKTSMLRKVKFDINYPIGADYGTTSRIFNEGNHKMHNAYMAISVFDNRTGGFSHSSLMEMFKERFKMFGYRPTVADWLLVYKKIASYYIKAFLEQLFPKAIQKRRKRNYIKSLPIE